MKDEQSQEAQAVILNHVGIGAIALGGVAELTGVFATEAKVMYANGFNFAFQNHFAEIPKSIWGIMISGLAFAAGGLAAILAGHRKLNRND